MAYSFLQNYLVIVLELQIVTHYGILDHMQFFMEIEFLVSIDTTFIVDYNHA